MSLMKNMNLLHIAKYCREGRRCARWGGGALLVRVERQLGPNVVNCGGAIVRHSGEGDGKAGY